LHYSVVRASSILALGTESTDYILVMQALEDAAALLTSLFNSLALELNIYSLAHHLCKM